MRILVTASRTWTDEESIYDYLVWYGGDCASVTVVHGDCPDGGDQIADRIARMLGWEVDPHPADWKQYRRAAGHIRNAVMVKKGADVCLAFIENGSNGATKCAELAEKAGIPVERIEVWTF